MADLTVMDLQAPTERASRASQGRSAPPAALSDALDEFRLGPPAAADLYRRMERLFLDQGNEQLGRMQARAQKLMRDLGVVYRLYHEEPSYDHIIPFDLFPRIIEAQEWDALSQGVAQRLRIWNAFLQDIYSHQEVLKADIIPFQLVYDDPGFLRAATGLPVTNSTFVHAAAFDLARNAQGEWVVIEDYVSTVTGPSYAMQSRFVLGQIFPDLFKLAEIHPIHTYPTRLLEVLHASHATSHEPRVVMLSSDEDNQAYFEHSLLSRQMGVSLVRGDDLIVLNSRVFLKTIGGLEPIDVIYRQLDAAWLDPLEFRQDSSLGVPGLMNCVRKGTVILANAVGTSLGRNRALAAYMPKLARFYFNEPLLLPTVSRLLCHDRDQCDVALSQLASSRVCATNDGSSQPSVWYPGLMSEQEAVQLSRDIQRHRNRFVTEPVLPLSLLPIATPRGLEKRHTGLRLFAMDGPQPKVYPCGLTRFSVDPDSRVISAGLGGGIKDTWILGADRSAPRKEPLVASSALHRLRLNSRIADNLYWMGRNKSRAENTTRILKVLQQIQLEDQSVRHLRSWAPLWEALAHATGHSTHFFKRSGHVRKQSMSQYILMDPDNPSSVLSALRNLKANARASRESIPPEVWSIVNQLFQTVDDARQEQWFDQTEWPQLRALEDDLLLKLDALSGAVTHNLLRDDGWHFWNLGECMERAITTVLVARQVFMRRQTACSSPPQRDQTNLDALLRILGCQYAYRSLFQTRPLFHNVARLILQDRQWGRSVLSCLLGIRQALEAVFGDRTGHINNPGELPPLQVCNHLIGELEFTDLAPYFVESKKSNPKRLRPWLDRLNHNLEELALRIGDHYLHHQLFKILR